MPRLWHDYGTKRTVTVRAWDDRYSGQNTDLQTAVAAAAVVQSIAVEPMTVVAASPIVVVTVVLSIAAGTPVVVDLSIAAGTPDVVALSIAAGPPSVAVALWIAAQPNADDDAEKHCV